MKDILWNRNITTLAGIDKQKLKHLVWINFTSFVFTILFFTYKIIFDPEGTCLICGLFCIVLEILMLYSIYLGKINRSLSIVYMMPLVIYSFYLSEFNNHLPESETIYYTLIWLLGGLIYLSIYSNTTKRLFIFFILGIFTIWFHSSEAGLLDNYTTLAQDYIKNPFIILIFSFLSLYILRRYFESKYIKAENKLNKILLKKEELIFSAIQPVVHIQKIIDDEGQITDLIIKNINQSFEQHFKIKSKEVVNQKVSFIFNYIFRNSINSNRLFIINPKSQIDVYIEHLERWYNINIIYPADDEIICIFFDTTDQNKTILDLKDSRQKYKVLLEAIPDIFFIIDKDGIYEDFVIKDSDKLKINDSEIIGNSIYEVGFSEKMANKIFQCLQNSLINDTIESIEYALDTPNGTFMFEMRLAKLNSNSVISIARDITKRKTAEFQLEEAKNKAEDANNLKSAFLANLSHEIRTPMNAIIGSAEILAEPELSDDEKEEYSQAILLSGLHLLKMIDDTINLSKIETNTVEVKHSFVKVNQLLHELYNLYEPLTKGKKGIIFQESFGVNNPAFGFKTDRDLLYEIYSKLIDNAIKFTDVGMVKFGYEMISPALIEFFVEDTGIGIPSDEVDRIYERFYKIDNSNTIQSSGSGLGLPIAWEFVSILGGQLHLESELGKGSRFSFTLPFEEGIGYMKVVK